MSHHSDYRIGNKGWRKVRSEGSGHSRVQPGELKEGAASEGFRRKR